MEWLTTSFSHGISAKNMQPHTVIGDKPIYVFENHAEAIIPWGLYRNTQKKAAVLLTLDDHTDTLPAFFRYGYSDYEAHRDKRKWQEAKQQRLKKVNFSDPYSLLQAAKDLWHDEHICAACETDILTSAYIVAHQTADRDQLRPHLTYFPELCFYGCEQTYHNQNCYVKHSDLAIDDSHLKPLLEESKELLAILDSADPFILDIDLDYFQTWNSLAPIQFSFFTKLVQRANIITIATEPSCCEDLWIDDDSRWTESLDRLLQLIKAENPKASFSSER